jgi:hypothetical protein
MRKTYPWNKESVEKFDKETETLRQQTLEGNPPAEPPAETPPAAPPVTPPPAPPVTPPVAPPVEPPLPPGPSPAEQFAQAEMVRLKAQLEEERAARQAETAKLKEYEELTRQRELEKKLEGIAGEEFSGLDPEDAKKILRSAQELMRADHEALAGQMTEFKKSWTEREIKAQQARIEAQRAALNQAILTAVPELPALQQNPDFQKFLASPVRPGSPLTNQMDLVQAYSMGYGDYVVNSLKSWRANGPSPESIAQVSPAAALPGPEADPETPAGVLSEKQQSALFDQVRTGTITKEIYRGQMAKHKEALKAASKT